MNPNSPLDSPACSVPQAEGSAASGQSLDRLDLALAAALVGCLFVLFWKVIFTPAMFFYRDVFDYSYPHARFIQEAVRQGYLPYWNPYLNFGQPVLANPNFLFFYPYTLFLILLPIDLAYTMHYIAHFALAAVGTYLLARRWEQSRGAAFFAGFVFAFSGPVLSLGNFYNQVACAAWIPWALLLTDDAAKSRSRRAWVLLALVFSLQFLAAEPLTLLATFGLCLACAVYRSITGRPSHVAPNGWRILGGFILVGCLMLALCAIQFFPSLELLRESRRGAQGLPYAETTYWSFHPLSLLEVVVPNFFGPPFGASSLWTSALNSGNRPYFPSVFLGFVPVYFALAGWALGNNRRRGFVGGAFLTFLFLSFGRFTPVFQLFYWILPPLRLVRFPVKMLIPAALLAALLAGWGVDAFRQPQPDLSKRRARLLWPLKFMVACAGLIWVAAWVVPSWVSSAADWLLLRTDNLFSAGPAGGLGARELEAATNYFLAMLRLYMPGLLGFGLGGILWVIGLERGKVWARRALPGVALLGCAQLVLVNCEANPTVPKSFYSYRPPVLAHLQDAVSGPYRFCYIFRDPSSPFGSPAQQEFLNFDSIPEARNLTPPAQTAFRDRLVLARGAMLTGVEGIYNHDVEWSFPPPLEKFWVFALRELRDPARASCLLGRGNVKYFVSPVSRPEPTLREVARIYNGSTSPSYLYENLCAAPRAYVAGSCVHSRDAAETLARMSAQDFDRREEVIVAAAAGAVPPLAGAGPAGRVEIVARHPNEVILRAELFRPGYVVLLDRYDPNWHATVDGREVPVLRANLLFRAVQAGAGSHEVRFFYRQRGLRAGAIVSLAALALLLGLYFKR
jgi:hypothetical protein